MEEKKDPNPEISELKENEENDVLNALDDFDEKLNLTADEKDDENAKEDDNAFLNDEFQKIMKEFQEGMGQNMDSNPAFNDMFKNMNLEGSNMEELADNLLGEFLNKEILYEPMKEAKTAYEEYFKDKSKIPATELPVYEKQYTILLEIIGVLDNEPENKAKLTSLFENMQEQGTPPPIFGDSAFPFPINPMQSQGNNENCNLQ